MATEIQPKPRTAFRKVVDVGLGVASAGALALNLIPTLNIVGAGLQGGITVVQTGLDIHDHKGAKKAAITFATGALMTGLSFIPVLGDVGKAAILAEEGGVALKTASIVGKVEGAVGGGTTLLTETAAPGIFARIGNGFKTAKASVGKQILRIPGADDAYKYLLGKEAALTASTKTLIGKSPTAMKTARVLATDKAQTAAMYGATAASVGLSFLDNSNPGKLLRPETYADAPPVAAGTQAEGSDRRWQKYVDQRDQTRGKAATLAS